MLRPATRLGLPILIAGILIAIAAALGTVVWVLRSVPPLPTVVLRPLPNEPAAPPPVVAEKEDVQLPPEGKPPAPRLRARPASLAAIAARGSEAGSRVEIKPSVTAADPSPVVAQPPPPPAGAAPDAAPAVSAAVYTASDADVTPPQPLHQQWLRALPAGPPDEVVTIEVIVSNRGQVESVKVNSAPRSIGESMLFTMSLHAIKSWEFRPALKDGSPVRYRQVMSFGKAAGKLPPDPIQSGS